MSLKGTLGILKLCLCMPKQVLGYLHRLVSRCLACRRCISTKYRARAVRDVGGRHGSRYDSWLEAGASPRPRIGARGHVKEESKLEASGAVRATRVVPIGVGAG